MNRSETATMTSNRQDEGGGKEEEVEVEGHSEYWYQDTFAPLIEAWLWIRSLAPTQMKLRWPKFNFIAVHYCYMIGMTILFSIMIFAKHPHGIGLQYIDALFFAAGTATQSGLNTIDINLLFTYNQVVLTLGCCFCTPIFINTVVVMVRLYWFEKRFEHIVKEARAAKRSVTMSRTKSQMKGDKEKDPGALEAGSSVRNKSIQVLKNTLQLGGEKSQDPVKQEEARKFREKMGLQASETSTEPTPQESESSDSSRKDPPTNADDEALTKTRLPNASRGMSINTSPPRDNTFPESPSTPQTPYMGLNPRLQNRAITFADEEAPKEGQDSAELARIPERRDISKHIEFLERQNQKRSEAGALRIPGPRERDAGEDVKQLDEETTLSRLHTNVSNAGSVRNGSIDARSEASYEDRPVRRGITIDEPDHPAHHRDDDDAASTSKAERDKSNLSRRRRSSINLRDAPRTFTKTLTGFTNRSRARDEDPMPYLSWTATTGRNSAFLGLTQEQREELGGIEYRSLKTLAMILICYYVGFHLLGMVVLLPWIASTPTYANRVSDIGQNPLWWGIFTPASMFNDLGFTLNPDSMVQFQDSVLTLLFGSFLVIIGNTGFPCMLRFIIWFLSRFVASYGSPWWEELRFLLDHPRRCFTLLFPSKATWWLFWVLVGLNVTDLIFFIILDLNASVVTMLPVGYRVLNGWFQAVSTRTAGFASVSLSSLHSAIQVSYMVMMYISVFPIAISVRRTNVYEEKSLGIFGGEEDGDNQDQSYVSQHLRRQLSFDLWYIFLGLFIIAIVEGDRISNTNEYAFTIFSVLFEIVSAYGTVGLSLGYPNINASFSAEFRTLSKLVIIAMMIRGRHRGLPYALDRAILLPSEKMQQKEAAEAARQMQRRASTFAEGYNEFARSKTWEDGELDESGLPAQHIRRARTDDITPAPEHPGLRQTSTGLSQGSKGKSGKHKRVRSMSKAFVGVLNPSPTSNAKFD